ncbi:hypothetical protein ACFLYY_02650 [Patescibacteria group bacterium]
MTKILKWGSGLLAGAVGIFAGGRVLAETYTVDNIASSTGTVLDTVVQAIINVVITFLTDNLPLIIVLGVSISLVFWLIYKARNATHGG